jgi:hypothetical protein
MKIDIYQSDTNTKKFLSVRHGENVKQNLPDPDYRNVHIHKENVDISPSDNRLAFNSDKAIKAINTEGYYLHEALFITTTKPISEKH